MAFQDTIQPDLATVPGAMQIDLERVIPGFGTITFGQAPAGWLTQAGERRVRDYREYHFTPEPEKCEPCAGSGRDYSISERGRKCPKCKGTGDASRRQRMISVTTLIGQITPKDGLAPWAEARGVEGAVEAVRLRLVDPEDPASAANAVAVVRASRLGADRARDAAADRGLDIHDVLQTYMETGRAPRPADHLPEHQGYLAALIGWLRDVDPEPVAVEEIVCDPQAGLAGRYDFCGHVAGLTGLWDAKTQERGQVYPGAHLQLGLLERAMLACGDGEMDFRKVVVFAADGSYREMDGLADPGLVELALSFAQALKPVTVACESANRVAREARQVAA